MNNNEKNSGLAAIMSNTENTAKNYTPKRESNYSNTNINRSTKAVPKAKKQPIKYANIRTNQSIVDTLKGYQMSAGYSSRSALLKAMIKMCEPIILNKDHRKEKFNKEMKLIKIQREIKSNK